MRKCYTEEDKYRLVARHHSGESASSICTAEGIPKSTFYKWLEPYKTRETSRGHAISGAEYLSMKKNVIKLEELVAILKSVKCTVSSPQMERMDELANLYGQFSTRSLCEALEVPRGTFYNHVLRNKGKNKSYKARRESLSEQIREIYDKSNQIFGAKKITAVLKDQGTVVSNKMVAELMQEMNLASIRTSTKKTYSKIHRPKKKDSLQLKFTTTAPNQVWVSDTTQFRVKETTYYICVIIDLYSRKAIGHRVSKKHSTQLITATFKKAYKERRPNNKLIFHSDRGTQYTSCAFEELMKACGVTHSFSPTARPCHNAVAEAFFSSMKKEELYRIDYRSEEEFLEKVNKYIDFYNMERPHEAIGYKTPAAYERAFFERASKKASGN